MSSRLLLRPVSLLVAEDPLAALPDLISRPVALLVEATTSPLVNLFLTLGEGVVRLVAEPLHVHTEHLLGRSLPHTPHSATGISEAGWSLGLALLDLHAEPPIEFLDGFEMARTAEAG